MSSWRIARRSGTIEEAARFLGGHADGQRRPVRIVDARVQRRIDVTVEVEALPEGMAAFWIKNPAAAVHLVTETAP